MKVWRENAVAVLLLSLALLIFGLFQALPVTIDQDPSGTTVVYRGYVVWADIIDLLSRLKGLELKNGFIVAAFIASSWVVTSSPFLVSFLVKSRLLWWLYLVLSGVILLGISGMFLLMLIVDPPDEATNKIGSGFWMLILYPIFHLGGMLTLHRQSPAQAEGEI